jgi:nitrite reductase/ring-hydroxylating ferredoxin subunit/DMSO/TMAO reductase YedYZ heme-binding membrane subunit
MYDLVLLAGITSYLVLFVAIGRSIHTAYPISIEILFLRALATCATLMLHIVLCIGPLARLDRRYLPILYNRRHLGVATFVVAAVHGLLAIGYYHGFGRVNPFVSILTSNTRYDSVSAFPFEILGIVALAILFLLAATSHDFWQKLLGPNFWKSLHMLVYVAYAAVLMHVAMGALQSETNPIYALLVMAGFVLVTSLHLATAYVEHLRDRSSNDRMAEWCDVASADEIPINRAKIVVINGGERIAVFRHEKGYSAVTNVCAHQRGPLGEGKVVDGCITCPWHGWQYRPDDGQSPPPFTEKIATYPIRIIHGRVLVDPQPNPPGTLVEPAQPKGCTHVQR